jgi:c(7)-type cytochrome triheme protein
MLLAGLGVTAGLVAVLLVGSPGLGQVQTPPDFTLEKDEGSPGAVTFSHDKHKAKVDKCTTCHLRDFKMKRGQSGKMTMEALGAGKFCGACHDGKTQVAGVVVFAADACDKCHQ